MRDSQRHPKHIRVPRRTYVGISGGQRNRIPFCGDFCGEREMGFMVFRDLSCRIPANHPAASAWDHLKSMILQWISEMAKEPVTPEVASSSLVVPASRNQGVSQAAGPLFASVERDSSIVILGPATGFPTLGFMFSNRARSLASASVCLPAPFRPLSGDARSIAFLHLEDNRAPHEPSIQRSGRDTQAPGIDG